MINAQNKLNALFDAKQCQNSRRLIMAAIIALGVFLAIELIKEQSSLNRENNSQLELGFDLKERRATHNDLQVQIDKLTKEKSQLERENASFMKTIEQMRLDNEESMNRLMTNQARQDVVLNKLHQLNEESVRIERNIDLIRAIQSSTNTIEELIISINQVKRRLEAGSLAIESIILDSNEQFDLIKEWLGYDKTVKFKLLYRMSIDGYSPEAFHQKCDNHMTLVLIKTAKGLIIGGYTEVSWGRSGFQFDPNAFLFSVSLKKKYHVDNVSFSIFGGSRYLAAFGFNDLTMNQNTIYSKFPKSYGLGAPALELTGGDEVINASEIEVFKITVFYR